MRYEISEHSSFVAPFEIVPSCTRSQRHGCRNCHLYQLHGHAAARYYRIETRNTCLVNGILSDAFRCLLGACEHKKIIGYTQKGTVTVQAGVKVRPHTLLLVAGYSENKNNSWSTGPDVHAASLPTDNNTRRHDEAPRGQRTQSSPLHSPLEASLFYIPFFALFATLFVHSGPKRSRHELNS